MPLPIWPPALPAHALRDAFQVSLQDPRWSFRPDGGPALMRPKGMFPKNVVMEFMMSAAQVAILENFFAVILGRGTRSFEYAGTRGEIWEARFAPEAGEPYRLSPAGADNWRVSMTWEILP